MLIWRQQIDPQGVGKARSEPGRLARSTRAKEEEVARGRFEESRYSRHIESHYGETIAIMQKRRRGLPNRDGDSIITSSPLFGLRDDLLLGRQVAHRHLDLELLFRFPGVAFVLTHARQQGP